MLVSASSHTVTSPVTLFLDKPYLSRFTVLFCSFPRFVESKSQQHWGWATNGRTVGRKRMHPSRECVQNENVRCPAINATKWRLIHSNVASCRVIWELKWLAEVLFCPLVAPVVFLTTFFFLMSVEGRLFDAVNNTENGMLDPLAVVAQKHESPLLGLPGRPLCPRSM